MSKTIKEIATKCADAALNEGIKTVIEPMQADWIMLEGIVPRVTYDARVEFRNAYMAHLETTLGFVE